MFERKDLYRSMAKSMLGKYSVYLANLVSLMVLARLFTPENYGVVGSVAVFLVFFQLMAEAGLGPAIINEDRLSSKDRDGIFSLTLLLGLILSTIFFFLAPLFEIFYGIQGVVIVVPFVAVALFFLAASVVPNAFLVRQQSFYKIAIAGFVAEVVSTASVIVLSLKIDQLSALAAKGPISAATMAITVWFFSSKTDFGRPTVGKHFAAIKPLLNFSGYQFGFNFINYFSRNLDNILVGKYMGPSALGAYGKAYQLMCYPLMLLTFAMTPAIQPVIRKHAGDRFKVEEIHRDFTFKLSLVGALASLLMFFLAEWIVLIVLGERWRAVVPIIQILAMAIPVQVVLSTSGSFFQAMGRADLLFQSGTLSAVVMIVAIVIGVFQKDLVLLSWLLVAAFHINFLQAYFFLYKKVFNQDLMPFVCKTLPVFIGVMFLILIFI